MLYSTRSSFKPFAYDFAYDLYEKSTKMVWSKDEVPLHTDIRDYSQCVEADKKFIVKLMLLFTQLDVEVGSFYIDYMLQRFKLPELRMLITSIADRECTHQDAYAYFVSTLGMDDSTFTEWLDINPLLNKIKVLGDALDEIKKHKYISDAVKDYLSIAIYSGLGEGVSLFSSFAMLMSFSLQGVNKFKGLGTIVAWSVRDENLHVTAMQKLSGIIKRNLTVSEIAYTKEFISIVANSMLQYEFDFVDFIFDGSAVEHITVNDVKDYICNVLKRRLQPYHINVESLHAFNSYNHTGSTVLDDLMDVTSAVTVSDFFAGRETSYSRNGVSFSNISDCNFN